MKRYLTVLLCCLLLLGGCGEGEKETPLSAGELASAVAGSQLSQEGLTVLSGEVLAAYLQSCGLEGWEDAAVWTGTGMDAREITVVLLADQEGAEHAAECLEKHRQSRIGDFFGYAPEQAQLLERAQVVLQGRCAAFLACEDMKKAKEAFDACLDGQSAQVLSSPAPQPSESSRPSEPSESPQPSPSATARPDQTPEPTQASEVNPGLDISDFPKFDPPNEVDMTLYDNTAVVTAWKTGEETGLSEKDKTILARCREIFGQVITEGMTDFEKELALHDWLIEHGEYDAQSRDNVAHIGQPDNNNPYGMLNGGYGICLGFATTFQLFMDLAGVECMTVVGAAYESSQDHAWNMVKLDGEWYCVDVTWNAGSVNSSHRYFNVTSDYMRSTMHQWDYLAVPEAAATDYRWEGTEVRPAG